LLITPATPNGDQIIYGEAVDSENQAEIRNGRRHAAEDAMRLYYRLQEYFPSSPLAAESLWRAADIRWQLEKSGVMARPSAREESPDMRTQIDDETMKEVIKKYPHTKWADLAAYDMIDNKLCGDWKGESTCPEKESDIYEHYAHEHPQSPKAAEALYNAAWRQAALVDIQKGNHQTDKAEHARKKALEVAEELVAKNPEGDWKARASTLIYALQQGLVVYGNGAGSSDQ
jgi:outer membrane protein assembly factor BamD (BamD/ComL family)